MTHPDKITKKIAALFAQAEHEGTGDAEAAAFAAKAQDLLTRHNLTRSDIGPEEEWSTVEFAEIPGGAYSLGRLHLLDAICAANGVSMSYLAPRPHTNGHKNNTCRLFGRTESIEGVLALFSSLDVYASAKMKTLQPTIGQGFGRTLNGLKPLKPVQVRRSWLFGFAAEIGSRLAATNEQIDDEHNGSLLPVIRDDLSKAEDMRGDTSTGSKPANIDGASMDRGTADAHNVDIGQTPIARPTPALSAA